MGGIAVRLQAGDRLHLWMRPVGDQPEARLRVAGPGGSDDLAVAGPTRNPLPVEWTSPADGDVRLDWDDADTQVSVAYAYTPSTVAETGICLVWTAPASRVDGARYRFHAHPPFGWMNDPNGLCEVDGVTHLFYQHNPHGRRWNTMHWGHATSLDGGITWTHLPVALLPREELVRGVGRQGGAYSGSALPRPDGTLRLFYTDRDDRRPPAQEWQMTAVLGPEGRAGPSSVVLDAHPPIPDVRDDWRDPFVFAGPDGRLKMLLGGADAAASLVLLYETDDAEGAAGWRFVDVLFREPAPRPVPAECPCLIPLDGTDLSVLIFGLIGSRDTATRRRNLTRVHVGRFDGRHFLAEFEHELDFGTDCYAMQVWRGADGPCGIAWAANWTDVSADADFESAMTLPRRLLWREGRLATPPVDAVEKLRLGDPVAIENARGIALDTGLAEFEVELPPGQSFTLAFEHPTHELAMTYDGETLEFHYEPPGHRSVPSYRASWRDLRTLRVFVDVGLIEIFVDGGRICCTKRIDSSAPIAAIRLGTSGNAVVGRLWQLLGHTSAPRVA